MDEKTQRGTEIQSHSPLDMAGAANASSSRSPSDASTSDVALGMSSTQSLEILDAQDSCVKEQSVAITDAPVRSVKISLVESDSVKIGTTTGQGESNSLAHRMNAELEDEPMKSVLLPLGAAASPSNSFRVRFGNSSGEASNGGSLSIASGSYIGVTGHEHYVYHGCSTESRSTHGRIPPESLGSPFAGFGLTAESESTRGLSRSENEG